MAESLVSKQAQLDEIVSSRQAISMRAEADRVRSSEQIIQLKAQLQEEGADLEQGGLDDSTPRSMISHRQKRFKKLELKHVPVPAANAIDKLSLIVVNILRAFPLVRLTIVIYILAMHAMMLWVMHTTH